MALPLQSNAVLRRSALGCQLCATPVPHLHGRGESAKTGQPAGAWGLWGWEAGGRHPLLGPAVAVDWSLFPGCIHLAGKVGRCCSRKQVGSWANGPW